MKINLLFPFYLFPLWILAQNITYYNQIKPIIDNRCVSCHKTDGYAPFSLESYDDIASRIKFINYVVSNKIMPPWKANNHYRTFANDKSLSENELNTILKWIETGYAKGKSNNSIKTIINNKNELLNRKPDLILNMQKPFKIPAENRNIYICYKMPFEIKNDTFGSIVEFIPGNKSVVHHASYQILRVADDVNIFEGPDYFIYHEDSLNRVNDKHDYAYFKLIDKYGNKPEELYHNGWLPGTSPQIYPDNIGFELPKKGVLLIRNFHYSPSPIEVTDSSKFHIYFSRKVPERKIGFAAFQPKNPAPDGKWIIKAGDSNFTAHINVKFHNDVSLLNINPHMHRLGKYFIAYAVTPDSDTIRLIEIKNWDYNWQEFYRFKQMIKIPAGSVLHAEAVYDNSDNNPENPNVPAKDVLFEFGMNDNEEMMRLVLIYLPYLPGDELISLE